MGIVSSDRHYKFRVHCGYTQKGNIRWAKFFSFETAQNFCQKVFERYGRILSIEKI